MEISNLLWVHITVTSDTVLCIICSSEFISSVSPLVGLVACKEGSVTRQTMC